MSLRWLLMPSLPKEPLLDLRERQQLAEFEESQGAPELSKHVPRSHWIGAAGFIASGLLLMSLIGVSQFVSGFAGSAIFNLGMAGAFVGMYLSCAWMYHVQRFSRWARGFRHLGYELCPGCGYWLRGLSVSIQKCPECGAAREELKQLVSVERDNENVASARK